MFYFERVPMVHQTQFNVMLKTQTCLIMKFDDCDKLYTYIRIPLPSMGQLTGQFRRSSSHTYIYKKRQY